MPAFAFEGSEGPVLRTGTAHHRECSHQSMHPFALISRDLDCLTRTGVSLGIAVWIAEADSPAVLGPSARPLVVVPASGLPAAGPCVQGPAVLYAEADRRQRRLDRQCFQNLRPSYGRNHDVPMFELQRS